jgi:hypothetical protein
LIKAFQQPAMTPSKYRLCRRPFRIFCSVPLLVFLLVFLSCGGCQVYQFGAPTMYRFDIRSVYVPVAESDSYRRFLGLRLTEALIKQIELDTPFVIAEPQNADSFLVARIVRDTKSVEAETINDDPRTLQYGIQVEVTWTDRAGQPLTRRQVIRINEDAVFIPEGGQSLTTAQQEVINSIARDIVGQMEVAW